MGSISVHDEGNVSPVSHKERHMGDFASWPAKKGKGIENSNDLARAQNAAIRGIAFFSRFPGDSVGNRVFPCRYRVVLDVEQSFGG